MEKKERIGLDSRVTTNKGASAMIGEICIKFQTQGKVENIVLTY